MAKQAARHLALVVGFMPIFESFVFMFILYHITHNNAMIKSKKYNYPPSPFEEILFSACICGGDFAILFAVDALIVFLQLCGLFQVGWLEPYLPRKRRL